MGYKALQPFCLTIVYRKYEQIWAVTETRVAEFPILRAQAGTTVNRFIRFCPVPITLIAKLNNWQNHSIRGFVSGQVTKKMGLKVESAKSEAGERTYRIA